MGIKMKPFGLEESNLPYNKELRYLNDDKIPKKVTAICSSVIKLYNEGTSFYKMTIADIAKDAEIGKGTIYEYFSNKEEIILTAMLAELKKQLILICEIILQKTTFDDKYDSALDWIEQHVKANMFLRQMILARYSEDADEAIWEIMNKMIHKTKCEEVLDSIITAAVSEGLIKSTFGTLEKKAAFATVAFFISYLMQPNEFGETTLEEVKLYCKGLFLLILKDN